MSNVSATFTNPDKAITYAQGRNMPLVIKAVGLANGRGVIVCKTSEEAEKAINQLMCEKILGSAGDVLEIESWSP